MARKEQPWETAQFSLHSTHALIQTAFFMAPTRRWATHPIRCSGGHAATTPPVTALTSGAASEWLLRVGAGGMVYGDDDPYEYAEPLKPGDFPTLEQELTRRAAAA